MTVDPDVSWSVKTRGFVGPDVRWSLKTRGFVGPNVRWRVKTRGFVGPNIRWSVKNPRAIEGFFSPPLADKSLARYRVKHGAPFWMLRVIA